MKSKNAGTSELFNNSRRQAELTLLLSMTYRIENLFMNCLLHIWTPVGRRYNLFWRSDFSSLTMNFFFQYRTATSGIEILYTVTDYRGMNFFSSDRTQTIAIFFVWLSELNFLSEEIRLDILELNLFCWWRSFQKTMTQRVEVFLSDSEESNLEMFSAVHSKNWHPFFLT